jgi:hypothetical protein
MNTIDMSFDDKWQELRGQFGWFNYKNVEDFIISKKAELNGFSFYMNAIALNRSNMDVSIKTGVSSDILIDPIKPKQSENKEHDQSGVLMIYAPEINPSTYLHFSWKGSSCALRDYTKKNSIPNRNFITGKVRSLIKDSISIPNKARLEDVDFWYNKTVELNKGLIK